MNNPPRQLQVYSFKAVAEILIQFGEEAHPGRPITSQAELDEVLLAAVQQLESGQGPSDELRENEHYGHVTFKGFVVTNHNRVRAKQILWRKVSTVLDDVEIKLTKHLGGRLLGSNLKISHFRISKVGFRHVPRKVGVYFFDTQWKEKRRKKYGRLPQRFVGPQGYSRRGKDRKKQYWHGRGKK